MCSQILNHHPWLKCLSSQDGGGDPRAGHEGGPQHPGEGGCGRDCRPTAEQPEGYIWRITLKRGEQ